uniref:DUF4806 domain-containing protein n=1 Tax=Caenorhabditis tropicalis TaxID=1561998 RepID=A0A1I7U1U0_9PELO
MLAAHVKEELLPSWKQPPPHGFKFPQLPAEDPNRTLSVTEYHEKLKSTPKEFRKLRSIDVSVKRVVLNEIEKIPDMWSKEDTFGRRKYYPLIACSVFKRTGALLTISSLRRTLKSAITSLRSRLIKAISELKLDGMDLEKHLWKWNSYPSILFYRHYMQAWEGKLRNKMPSDSSDTENTIQMENDDENESMDFANDNSSISNDIEVDDMNRTHTDSDQQHVPSFHRGAEIEHGEQNEAKPMMDPISSISPSSSHGRQLILSTPNQERELISPFSSNERNITGADSFQREIFPFDQAVNQVDSSRTNALPCQSQVPPIFLQQHQQLQQQHNSSQEFHQFRMEEPRGVSNGNEKPPFELDSDSHYLLQRIERISQEQPTRKKLLHDILLQTVLAFERNESSNPIPIFDQLKRIFDE